MRLIYRHKYDEEKRVLPRTRLVTRQVFHDDDVPLEPAASADSPEDTFILLSQAGHYARANNHVPQIT